MIVGLQQPALQGGRPLPIRGWLIVLAITLIVTLLQLGLVLLFSVDALDAANWNPGVVRDGIDDGTAFTMGFVTTAALFAWWLTVAVLFFRRSQRFPIAAITLLVIWVILTFGQLALFRTAPTIALAIQLLAIAAIVSYLRRSKRVKATFTG